MSLIPKEIEGHYQQVVEAERLAAEQGELERLRTHEILARELPAPPAVIFDVGGAAGVYAIPLAKQGYQVHLIDPVERHLRQARAAAEAAGVALASIVQGDARKLDVPTGTADAALLLGPLYHLVEQLGPSAGASGSSEDSETRRDSLCGGDFAFRVADRRIVARFLQGPRFQENCGGRSGVGAASQSDRQRSLLHDGVFPPSGGAGGRDSRGWI